jgi:hypothetical protein
VTTPQIKGSCADHEIGTEKEINSVNVIIVKVTKAIGSAVGSNPAQIAGARSR